MLVLFDIDMTLVTTRGSGIEAIEAAGSALFGAGFRADSIAYGGRIDPVIFAELLEVNGVEPTPANARALSDGYAQRLAPLLEGRTDALPGARELVDAVVRAGAVAGLLTGNVEPTGTAKLVAAGFDMDVFRVRVWGDDSPHHPPERDHLPGVAIERHAAMVGERLDAQHAAVVGDTIHDVACARAHGLRCLAVATGTHDSGVLKEAGADLVVDDLTDTERLAAWLTNPGL